MSDDLFEGIGTPYFPPDKPQHGQRAKIDPATKAKWAAARAAHQVMVTARQAKRDQEWAELNKNLANDPTGIYTAIWVGHIPEGTTPSQHSKQICGKQVATKQMLFPRQHKLLQGKRYLTLSKGNNLTPSMVKDVAIFRLDAKQALMAKLNKLEKEYVVEDLDGKLWAGLATVITASRLERDCTMHDDALKSLLGLLKRLLF